MKFRFAQIVFLWTAFLLRVWGLDFGLPYKLHPDESKFVVGALNLYLKGELGVGFVNNPPALTYILSLVDGFWLWLNPYVATTAWVTGAFYFARFWLVVSGVLLVALLYPVGKRLYNRQVGLLALILFSLLFFPAREAHFAVPDALLAFLTLLAIYQSLIVLQTGRLSAYLIAGIATGIAAATKLTGALVILALLTAHLFRSPDLHLRPHKYLWAGLAAAAATFCAMVSYALWDVNGFITSLNEHLRFGSEGYDGLQMFPGSGWVFYLDVLKWGIGLPLCLVVVIALGHLLYARFKPGLVLIIFSVALFVYMGHQEILFARFLLPAVAPLVILAAYELVILSEKSAFFQSHATLLWPVIVIVLVTQPLTNLVWFNHLLTLPDTREMASDWLSKEAPANSLITKEHLGFSVFPDLHMLPQAWPYHIASLESDHIVDPNGKSYLAHKAHYIVISNFVFERVKKSQRAEQIRATNLTLLAEKGQLIKTFNPYRANYNGWFSMDQIYGPAGETLQRNYAGPLIKIYRLPVENQPFVTTEPTFSVALQANFAAKLTLLGYDLPRRRAEAGGYFPLTLTWQVEQSISDKLVMFNHLLDRQQANWGGYDRLPQEVADTTLWQPGEIIVDTFQVPIAPDAPPGIYTLDIGLYKQADASAVPLPLVRDGQPIDQNSIRIGPLKVGQIPSEQRSTVQQQTPEHPLAIQLGNPPVIRLNGYSLSDGTGQPIQNLNFSGQSPGQPNVTLTLFWESLAPTASDWSVFAHVRNQAGDIVAQKDSPAGSGLYPTSLWDSGETIVDKLVIPLPAELPPDSLILVVGLYNLGDGSRLAVPDYPNNEIPLVSEH